MARIDIITRTFDRPALLERTLLSLVEQTFEDWQWVVVAPVVSSGLSDLLLRHQAALRGRVKVLTYAQPTPGMRGQPLNHALRHSESDLVTILDDDDTWEATFLAEMIATLDSAPAPVGGVVCQTLCLEESSVEEGLIPQRHYILNPDLASLTLAQLAMVNQFCIHAFVYRRSTLLTVGDYPEDYPVLEDWHFNLRFLRHFDVVVLPKVLTRYHQRPTVSVGTEANSLHAELDSHKFCESRLINSALRKDLDEGNVGLGLLMAFSAQNRQLADRLRRIESRVLQMSEKVGKIDSRTKAIKDRQ